MTRTRLLAFLLVLIVAAIGVAGADAKPPPVPRYVDGKLVPASPAAAASTRSRVIGAGTIVVAGDRSHAIGSGRIVVQDGRKRAIGLPTYSTQTSTARAADGSTTGLALGEAGAGFAAGVLAAALLGGAVLAGRGRRRLAPS
jgi:hypothetical protein